MLKLTERLEKIFSEIDKTEVFADIGCDHGYIAKKMIESGKCKKVIISDISEKCLEKAKALLSEELSNGKAIAKVSDGFTNIPNCDTALIAGMGGEEIIKILSEAKTLPDRLILQPMKNFDKLRIYCTENNFKIERDFIFYSENKYYVLIVISRGIDRLSQEEIEFGRTNLIEKSSDFLRFLDEKVNNTKEFLKATNISDEEKIRLSQKLERLQNVRNR